MKNEMKLNNKGFSLVELIVVIAIMAILVGVLAPSVLGQIDKAKQSKDKQAVDAVATAVAIAWADQDITDTKSTDFTVPVVHASGSQTPAPSTYDSKKYFEVIYNTIGFQNILFESDQFKAVTALTVKVNSTTGKVTVSTGSGANDYSITK